jgi:nucleoid DNA-binding protein
VSGSYGWVDHNPAKNRLGPSESEVTPKMSTETGNKPITKTELLEAIATETSLTRKQVQDVLESLSGQISKSLGKSAVFTLPGLLKIEKKQVPARPAKTGVPNPFKPGELMDVAAKPASTKITVRPLKNLKEM